MGGIWERGVQRPHRRGSGKGGGWVRRGPRSTQEGQWEGRWKRMKGRDHNGRTVGGEVGERGPETTQERQWKGEEVPRLHRRDNGRVGGKGRVLGPDRRGSGRGGGRGRVPRDHTPSVDHLLIGIIPPRLSLLTDCSPDDPSRAQPPSPGHQRGGPAAMIVIRNHLQRLAVDPEVT